MCVVSMVMDHHLDKWKDRFPWTQPWRNPIAPQPFQPYPDDTRVDPSPLETFKIEGVVTNKDLKKELEELKKEFQDFKKLMEKAIEYDKRTNQPNCEDANKKELIKKIAEALGIDVKEIL